jgi:hypothetical protein
VEEVSWKEYIIYWKRVEEVSWKGDYIHTYEEGGRSLLEG